MSWSLKRCLFLLFCLSELLYCIGRITKPCFSGKDVKGNSIWRSPWVGSRTWLLSCFYGYLLFSFYLAVCSCNQNCSLSATSMEGFVVLQRKVLKAQAYTCLSGRQALKFTGLMCRKSLLHCFHFCYTSFENSNQSYTPVFFPNTDVTCQRHCKDSSTQLGNTTLLIL